MHVLVCVAVLLLIMLIIKFRFSAELTGADSWNSHFYDPQFHAEKYSNSNFLRVNEYSANADERLHVIRYLTCSSSFSQCQ